MVIMTRIELDVLFKKMQKDDKKEVLEFHIIDDEIPQSKGLIDLAGSIAVLQIDGNEKFTAEFKKIQRDSKKVVLQFEVKGDNEDKVIKLYKLAGSHVQLDLEPSQISIEEFYDGDAHEGLEYNVDGTGAVVVPDGQLNMDEVDDIEVTEDDLPFEVEVSEEHDDELLN